eukprot:2175366-Amphidinium_carterae.1
MRLQYCRAGMHICVKKQSVWCCVSFNEYISVPLDGFAREYSSCRSHCAVACCSSSAIPVAAMAASHRSCPYSPSGTAVVPGKCLVQAGSGGRGTYYENGSVYASVAGELKYIEDSLVEVSVPSAGRRSGAPCSVVIPEAGSQVVARVVRMQLDRVDLRVVAIGNVPVSELFRGVIRKQDVRPFEVDK